MVLPIIPWRPGERPEHLEAILTRADGPTTEQIATVNDILVAVRQRGDAALIEFTERFDGVHLTPQTLRFDRDRLEVAPQALARRAGEVVGHHPDVVDSSPHWRELVRRVQLAALALLRARGR